MSIDDMLMNMTLSQQWLDFRPPAPVALPQAFPASLQVENRTSKNRTAENKVKYVSNAF